MKITIELERATDMPEETWISHCLELDLVAQGSTPQKAIEAVAEAIDMTVQCEIRALQISGQIPDPGWDRAFGNVAEEIEARFRAAGSSPGSP